MSKLLTIDPAGRVDVLAYRLAERGAQRVCPREWPVLAPHVERWVNRTLGEITWKDAPLATVALLPGMLLPSIGIYTSAQSGYIDNLLQVIGVKAPPSLPKPSSPVAQPPKAPITAAKMTTWSTNDLAEVEAQRGAQYALDTQFFVANSSGGNKGASWPTIPPPGDDPETDKTLIWVALGAGALGLILLARR